MFVLIAAFLLGACCVVGGAWIGWWAAGGGLGGVVFALSLTPLTVLLAHRIWLFASVLLWDGGSIRQVKRRLRDAEGEGRKLAALKARVELVLLRQRRRG